MTRRPGDYSNPITRLLSYHLYMIIQDHIKLGMLIPLIETLSLWVECMLKFYNTYSRGSERLNHLIF